MAKTKTKTATAKRERASAQIPRMTECVQTILGHAYDCDELPVHMQVLLALGPDGTLLGDPRDRRLFGAGFITALLLANVAAATLSHPETKNSIIHSVIKKAIAEGASLIRGTSPKHGNPDWDGWNDLFWHGKISSRKLASRVLKDLDPASKTVYTPVAITKSKKRVAT